MKISKSKNKSDILTSNIPRRWFIIISNFFNQSMFAQSTIPITFRHHTLILNIITVYAHKIFQSTKTGMRPASTRKRLGDAWRRDLCEIRKGPGGAGISIASSAPLFHIFQILLHFRLLGSLQYPLAADYAVVGAPTWKVRQIVSSSHAVHLWARYTHTSLIISYSFYLQRQKKVLLLKKYLFVRKGGAIHWIVYGFEWICAFFLWSITVGVDSIFGFYALHMVGELRLLAARFQSLRSSKNYKKDLKDCIDRHILLIETQSIMERVFGFLAILLAITCAIVLCSIVFQVTQVRKEMFTETRNYFISQMIEDHKNFYII